MVVLVTLVQLSDPMMSLGLAHWHGMGDFRPVVKWAHSCRVVDASAAWAFPAREVCSRSEVPGAEGHHPEDFDKFDAVVV